MPSLVKHRLMFDVDNTISICPEKGQSNNGKTTADHLSLITMAFVAKNIRIMDNNSI